MTLNVVVVASVYPLVFLGELPDKTMFASLVLASRGRPRATWLGATLAFAVHVAIAVTAGEVLFRLLPRRVVDAVAAVLFALGAIYAWRLRKDTEAEPPVTVRDGPGRHVLAAAIAVFVAEWGDLTQLLTANLALRFHDPLSVGIGALGALSSVAAIGAFLGPRLLGRLRPAAARVATSAVLAGLALWMTLSATLS